MRDTQTQGETQGQTHTDTRTDTHIISVSLYANTYRPNDEERVIFTDINCSHPHTRTLAHTRTQLYRERHYRRQRLSAMTTRHERIDQCFQII